MRRVLAVLACGLLLAWAEPGAATAPEIIGRARTNNRVEVVTLPIAPASAFVSAVSVRSGSLAMLLVAVEIDFADGGMARQMIGETLAPGQQSRRIAVDGRRAIRRIIVVKRPGLREGETELQVLGFPSRDGR